MKIFSQLIQKQCLILIALFFIGFQTFSQQHSLKEIKPDQRLYQCFPKDYVDGLKDNPRLLLYYNFYLDHAFFFVGRQDKPSQGIDITTVAYKEPGSDGQTKLFDEDLSKFDVKKFCALKYAFNLSPDRYTNYLLGNTGNLLVFYPINEFVKQYNDYLATFGISTSKKR